MSMSLSPTASRNGTDALFISDLKRVFSAIASHGEVEALGWLSI